MLGVQYKSSSTYLYAGDLIAKIYICIFTYHVVHIFQSVTVSFVNMQKKLILEYFRIVTKIEISN